MNTLPKQINTNIKNNDDSSLLEIISKWPDWKIQALCLDESDLQIKQTIEAWRLDSNTNLHHF